MKISAARAVVDKELDKLKKLLAWSESTVCAKADGIREAQNKKTSQG